MHLLVHVMLRCAETVDSEHCSLRSDNISILQSSVDFYNFASYDSDVSATKQNITLCSSIVKTRHNCTD